MKTHTTTLLLVLCLALSSCNSLERAVSRPRPYMTRTTSMRMGAGPNGAVGPVTVDAPAFDPRDVSFGTAQENLFSE